MPENYTGPADVNKAINRMTETFKASYLLPERLPVSVYRLQFNSAFTFRDAAGLVAYLNDLGITDCYASPYLKARRGSQHGYDISEYNALNPEIGSEEEYRDFVKSLQKYNMGQILDFVPNHMSVFDNPKWQDVLENGPSSLYANFFDIDWKPVKAELQQKVLLPILEDLYGIVLERGQIALVITQGTFYFEYRNHRLPVGPRTAVPVLESSLNQLQGILSDSHPDLLELQSIITACKNLPEREETEPERMAERQREKEIIKKRLGGLCQKNKKIKSALDEIIGQLNGRVGDNASFLKLHELLEKQAYRLSYWRVAGEEINYRRFFDINELVALRMEDPVVFSETHRLVRELFGKGMLTGIRIDHVDGLFDPYGYLTGLQKDFGIELGMQKMLKSPDISRIDAKVIKPDLYQKLNVGFPEQSGRGIRPVFIVVEKILGENETLNKDWPVEGTTGYEFMTALNQLFVDKKQRKRLLDAYRKFTGITTSFENIVYNCKNLMMRTSMAGEVNLLAHQLNIVSEKSWQYRDFTLNSLRDAIREVIACFPVYRTYINAYTGSISKEDGAVIDTAIAEARRRNPAVSSAIFDFVRDTLYLKYPTGMDESGHNLQNLFVMRFQQFTGPVMAKGMEDTAFYIYNPLVSLNEVGGNPRKFGASMREFHKQNAARQISTPHSFVATSTHDSKRSEDVRARINVLSEIPREWKSALDRWSGFNKKFKRKANGVNVPENNEEYLIYQTLIVTCPLNNLTGKDSTGYCTRIQNYILKAVKEAKIRTSWINPNTGYEEGVLRFIEAILNPSPENLFLADFKKINQLAAVCGMYSSLSQVVLKIFSPGVPDVYQGNELWSYNLTDPDNRNTVDYERRARLLNRLKEQSSNQRKLTKLIDGLLGGMDDGRIKLYVTWKSLNYRKDNRELFEGTYLPLEARGSKKNHLCAFAWTDQSRKLITAVPRFMTSLTRQAAIKPLGEEVWKDTRIVIPRRLRNGQYRNIFTGEIIEANNENSPGLLLSEVFRSFPVAVLESITLSE